MRAKLYYESHVTIDPPTRGQERVVQALSKEQGFRLAKLFMRKAAQEEKHQDDAFMTAHSMELDDIRTRTANLVRSLQMFGIKVRRYKIEDTVLDSRNFDELGLL